MSVAFALQPDEWKEHAACAGEDPELFFHPDGTRGPMRMAREKQALAVCARCPVAVECRKYAEAVREPYGVWGGTTESDRSYRDAHGVEAVRNETRLRPVDTFVVSDQLPGEDDMAEQTLERVHIVESEYKPIPYYTPPDLNQLQLVRVGDLQIDPSYQREFSARKNEERARDFRPNQIGFLEVSRRSDGSLWCVDGQHRARLLIKLFGEDTMVPAVVYGDMTHQQEADRFIYVNNHRATVQPVDIYKARRARGDETVLAIDSLLLRHGLQVAGDYREGVVSAASALLTVHSRYGMKVLETTISTLKTVWLSDRDAFRADMMLALAWTLSTYASALDLEVLTRRLKDDFTAKQVVTKARARRVDYGGDLGTNIAIVLVEAYNLTQPRNRKLPTPVDVRPAASKRVNDQRRLEELQREARDARRPVVES